MVQNAFKTGLRAVLLGWAIITAGSIGAGGEPLYRHALERWKPDSYQVFVFHHEPLSSESQQLVDALAEASGESGVNFTVAVVDVNQPMPESTQMIWYTQSAVEPPWVVVSAPGADDATPPVWSGSLQAGLVRVLIDSPARRKVVEGLLAGDVAVWVLVECGDAVRDEAAVDLLAAELRQQQLKLAPPPATTKVLPGSTQSRATGGFSLVRVTRNNPAEEFFLTNLLHGATVSHTKPVAFPVFGRGRTAGVFAGRRLNSESIASVCAQLTGTGTNDAKASYPGKDLLLAANWEARLGFPTAASTPLTPESTPTTNRPLAVVSSTSSALATNLIPGVASASETHPSTAGGYARIGVIVFVLTAAFGFFILRSRRRGLP